MICNSVAFWLAGNVMNPRSLLQELEREQYEHEERLRRPKWPRLPEECLEEPSFSNES